MKATVASLFLASLAAGAIAAEKANLVQASDFTPAKLQAFNAPNAVSMSTLRERKVEQKERDRAAGVYDNNRYKKARATKCKNGKAGEYSCNNIDLLGFLRHQDLGSVAREGNDIWGMCQLDFAATPFILTKISRMDRLLQRPRVCSGWPGRRHCLCRGQEERQPYVPRPPAHPD